MNAIIVNCFDTYEDRIDLIHDYFIRNGHSVTIIQSDFRHIKKVHRKEEKSNFIFIKSKPYYKNMSVERLSSHYKFAKEAFKLVNKIKPDLLYVLVPPNSLAKFASKYKIKNTNVKLVFDLIDLWPETMPVGKIKVFPPFTFWKFLRDNSFKYADIIVTECNLYQNILQNKLKGFQTETLYLAKRDINVKRNPSLNKNEIHLCYLGSINNIIDIEIIKGISKSINDLVPTTLHIIGDGESKDILINEVKNTGTKVKYYGKIYNDQRKQDIFDRCHFGLNIMKESVCVGLTMKSIDYFQHGLPLINNIKADTNEMVENYNVGINVTSKNIAEIGEMIMNTDLEELVEMKKNTQKVFNDHFSIVIFEDKLNEILKKI